MDQDQVKAEGAENTPPDENEAEAFIAWIRQCYKDDYNKHRANYESMADDIRFFAEDQWLNEDRTEREAQNRPVITEDHLAPAVRQITNDMRMNKPAVKVRPVDSNGDVEVAKIFEGLIRNIEQQSFSTTGNAYVKAGENGTISGMGAFRLTTEYSSDDGFDQDIRIRPIRNGLSVLWDADAQSPTRDDARRCWILQWMSERGFAETYPGHSITSFESPTNRSWFSDWYKDKQVLVAELFYKKPKQKTLWRLPDQRIIDVTDLKEPEQLALWEEGTEQRVIEGFEVYRCVVNGADVLEESTKWIGQYIPIIAVIGEEVFLNESTVIRGLVRVGKDSQRMINYHNSAAIEHVAITPKQPYLATVEQIAGHEEDWELANRENQPVLTYNHDPNAPGPPARAQPPILPQALLTLKQEAVAGLQATTNVYPSATGAQSNEISGVAIQRRETQGDVANFHFVDNLNTSISFCGKQLIDLIPRIYDGQRIVRILGEDDAEEMVEINVVDENGQIKNDLSLGKYDVAMVAGPSYSTKRQEAAVFFEKILESGNQELVANTLDLLVKNLDLPGADELYERLRKSAVAKGIVEPDPDKGDQPPGDPEPSPEDKIAEAQLVTANAEMITAEARKLEAMTKLGVGQTDARKKLAETEKAEAEADGQDISNLGELLKITMESTEFQMVLRAHVQAAIQGLDLGPIGPNGAQPPLA